MTDNRPSWLKAAEMKAQAAELERERLKQGLPHLFGFKWYHWAKAHFESTNHMSLLCAANQISKSSTQHRKMVYWATETKRWPTLWPGRRPRQFWLLYPSLDVATVEWKEKIEPESMPRGEFKNHPIYGWTVEFEKKLIKTISFNSGITIYIKSYAQDVGTLQSGTVDAIFCFPAGTLVLTPSGARPIEALRLDDEVISTDGSVQLVDGTLTREAEVITRHFSNGETVTATPDHPFWTENRGWVQFGTLTPDDVCLTVPGWKLIKKLSCLKASFFSAIRSIWTKGCGIISAIGSLGTCTSLSGSPCTADRSPRVMSSITGTKIRSTTTRRTSSYSPVPSIPGSTKRRSGASAGPGSLTVSGAASNSSRGAQSAPSPGFARRSADALLRLARASAAGILSRLARMPRACFVLDSAPIATKARVYNLTVSGSHTYFANGIATHNCDEELPEDLYDELRARLIASHGYFDMVFTATMGQMLWLMAMEGKGEQEKFPGAFKQQVSMYDCQTYVDGSPGHFTEARIKEIEGECRSKNEILRRVHGRFVREEGRIVGEFDPVRHFIKPKPIPRGWQIYSGIDGGSGGGGEAHPAAYAFVAVRPDFREGWLCHGWRGDDVLTTDGDVVDRWDIDCKDNHFKPVVSAYDPSAKDLGTISDRLGLSWIKAERSHDFGYGILNTLFKHGWLKVFDTPALRKFGVECMTVMHETPKRKRKDDLMDGGRYAVSAVPWDWSAIKGLPTEEEREKREAEKPWTEEDQRKADIKARRGEAEDEKEGRDPLDEIFSEWNEAYGN